MTKPRRFIFDIPKKFTHQETARFVILPLPYEKTTSYKKGTARGPDTIIAASYQVEHYDEELGLETFRSGIHVVSDKAVKRALSFNVSPEKFCRQLAAFAGHFINPRVTLISLGGEHSISYGLVKVFCKSYPKLSVLQLDAHSDLRNESVGTRYGHASVARRISELCPITQVGIRSLSEQDHKIINSRRIKTFLAHQIRANKQLSKKILKSLSRDVYLSIDLDVFDPAYMPGVGTPEPGGLSWYEVLDVLRPVFKTRRIVGIDVVELSPLRETHISEFTAAKLIYRLMGYTIRGR